MLRMSSWVVMVLLVASYVCEGYKVLVVFPIAGKSHSILGDGYVKNLLEAGHEVTYITPFPWKNPPKNLHIVDLSGDTDVFSGDAINVKMIMDKQLDFTDAGVLFHILNSVATNTYQNENVKKLMSDPKQQFDVAIVEWLYSELYCGFAAVFNCPFIWSSSVDPHPAILSYIDEYTNPAYVPTLVSQMLPPFTFLQRVSELWSQIKLVFFRNFVAAKVENEQFETLVGPFIKKRGLSVPDFNDLVHNSSLVLGNSHVSAGQAIRLPQSYKPILGYHISDTVSPLPEDLKKIMDSAKNGVIYFSLGSNLKSKDLPVELKKSLLEMFGELKQTVLWKFEEQMADMPKNVHILKWAPQPSILAHPNCILFITHGGLLSTTETIHYGVPIIGIPVFADQFNNVGRAVVKGYARRVDLSYTMTGPLKDAIQEMVSNPRYAEKAKELSAIYHDRPVKPAKELVHWVEHVVRTHGAPHLRSPALDMPVYQKLYLDLAVVLLTVLYVLVKIVKRVCGLCCAKKVDMKKKKK